MMMGSVALTLLLAVAGPVVPASGAPIVAAVDELVATGSCRVSGPGTAAPDAPRARAACETARARFAELFGEPVPGVRVVLREQFGYRTGVQGGWAVIYWPTDAAMRRVVRPVSAAGTYADAQWREVLPHEIAHALLAARFYGDDDAPMPRGGYGTPLPDWLDEGVAIWAEPLKSREKRLAQARALPAARLDLQTILSSPHPGAGNAAALAMRDGAPPPRDEALHAFYPQSIAVLGFVFDAGGRAAVVELARRLVRDPDHTAPLAGLPGLPADPAALQAAWEEWLASGARVEVNAARPADASR